MAKSAKFLLIVAIATGCSAKATTPPSIATDAAALDVAGADAAVDGTGAGDVQTVDATTDVAVPADVVTVDPTCAAACDKIATCDGFAKATCLKHCADADPCSPICIEQAKSCQDAADCLGDASNLKTSFLDGPYGSGWRQRADDVVFPDVNGDWTLSENFNGRDNYVFFFSAVGFQYATDLWKVPVKTWLKNSPKNVHFFFMSYADKGGSTAAQDAVTTMKANVDKYLSTADAFSQCLWQKRLHFAPDPIQTAGGPLLSLVQKVGGVAHIGIDRQQNWRQIGLLEQVGANVVDMKLVSYDLRMWNFQWQREQTLKAETVTLVPVHAATDGAGFTLDFDLPTPAAMAQFDTAQIDLGAWCKDHDDQNCSEWDYSSTASLCERDVAANGDATTACQQNVPEVVAVTEQLGICADATATCKADAECGAGKACKGYVAPVSGVKGTAADKKPCDCVGIDGKPTTHQRTCNDKGTGYGACECPCPLEIGRWITPYHREGRWVSDISEVLSYLRLGGKQRITFDAGNFPMVDFIIRLSNRNKGVAPVQMVNLFTGGSFNQDYNKKYQPLTVNIPADVKKVELYAIITGHGWGAEVDNCAEFCNHTHHFTVNGSEFVHDNPVAGTSLGCAEAVDTDGNLANQFGTWYLGRGGWCPGEDVKPYRVDVTAASKIGQDNILTYKGLFNGADYVPKPAANNPGGFGAVINMNSWLVFYK